jgi:hypothetical protein
VPSAGCLTSARTRTRLVRRPNGTSAVTTAPGGSARSGARGPSRRACSEAMFELAALLDASTGDPEAAQDAATLRLMAVES